MKYNWPIFIDYELQGRKITYLKSFKNKGKIYEYIPLYMHICYSE